MLRVPLETVLIDVAANVRRLRQQRGMTQQALADAAEMDPRSVQDIEGRRVTVSLGTLVRPANELGIAPAALLHPAPTPEIKRGQPRKTPST